MKRNHYILAGCLTCAVLAACGGGGGGSTVYTKAETKAYLQCAMSSNTRISTIDSSIVVPKGVDVPHLALATGTSPTLYELDPSIVSSTLLTKGGFGLTGTFDTYSANRTLKISLTPSSSTFANISASIKGNGKEIGTFSFPFILSGATPAVSFPVKDSNPTIGKNKTGTTDNDYLTGCVINYVTTFK